MTTIAISALPVAASAATTDVLPIVQSGTTKQLTNALLFTSPTLITPALGVATGTSVTLSGLNATNAAAPTIASGVTIAPTKQITLISGTAEIETITAPTPISAGGGTITLIPTGLFTWTTAGNIALAGAAVVSRALTMTYDVTTNKWYPSYV